MEMSKKNDFPPSFLFKYKSDRVGYLCGRLKLKNSLWPAGLSMLPVHKVFHLVAAMAFCWAWGYLWLSLSIKPSICSGPQERPPSFELPQARRVSVPHKLQQLGAFKMCTQLFSVCACSGSLEVLWACGQALGQTIGCVQADLLATLLPSLDTHPDVQPHTHIWGGKKRVYSLLPPSGWAQWQPPSGSSSAATCSLTSLLKAGDNVSLTHQLTLQTPTWETRQNRG